MEFRVRCYKGANCAPGGFQAVMADSAKEAAEQACGERLAESGQPARLRAEVHTMPARGEAQSFYSTAEA